MRYCKGTLSQTLFLEADNITQFQNVVSVFFKVANFKLVYQISLNKIRIDLKKVSTK